MTYYCRDTFGEVQLGEINDESNSTLVKDQIFLSTEKYEIVQHDNEFKVCRGECPLLRWPRNPLKWPRNPFNQIQTFYNLNAPSEFLLASRMNSYSFRIVQSCLDSHKVRQTDNKHIFTLRNSGSERLFGLVQDGVQPFLQRLWSIRFLFCYQIH